MSRRLKALFKRLPLPGKSPKQELEIDRENAEATTPNVESGGLGESDTPVKAIGKLRVAWPPKVICNTPLGAIRDVSGNYYPRDIGRSSQLGSAVFYQFGDTFCHKSNGDFIGVVPNTAALVLDTSNPTLSKYAGSTEEKVPALIGELCTKSGRPIEDDRYKIWSFSGVVETHEADGITYGVTWAQKRVRTPHDDPEILPPVAYVSVATVVYEDGDRIRAMALCDSIHFLNEEPQLGEFCAVRGDGDHIYVYGRRNTTSNDIVLGRVPKMATLEKSCYQYRTESGWVQLGDGLATELPAIFTDMTQGQVFKTSMFGQESSYRWAFIGCNSFADSKILMGRSEIPEGPWDIQELTTAYAIGANSFPYRYCMYIHPWASDEEKGDICVSWSEGGLEGRVLMAMLRLKTEPSPLEE